MKIMLKDGSDKVYENPVSVYDVALEISEKLAKSACSGKVDDTIVDLRYRINKDCKLEILTFDNEEGKTAFRHTASHILAQAVKRLYPSAKLAIGPSIKDGFYYDIDFDEAFTWEELNKIENEMLKIVKEKHEIKRFTLTREKAIQLMKSRNEVYKLDLIHELTDDTEISFYEQGEFVDLCAGPHLLNTKFVKAIKLTTIAGAYLKGDEKNKMLTRIYGTAFPSNTELERHSNRMEEAIKRDHRKLGKELGLFTLMEEGPGFPFFLHKGLTILNLLKEYWRKIHEREGYIEISTPIMLRKQLWETSGHWEHYRDNMYVSDIDGEEFAIKPMNCPGGMLVYQSEPHSYKELPLRIGELGLVHRHEKSGTMHGLMRVRSFTQDDAHIFMMKEQVTDEIKSVIRLIDEVYKTFGFKYHVELSTRPTNSIGSDEDWELATFSLMEALRQMDIPYILNEGDGAFYGPKVDFHLEDSIGRTWQCGTIQLDFQLPLRFHAEYIGSDGEKHRPIMIHRVIYGSLERFLGILIEHYAAKFPLWLTPVQVKILPISDKYLEYTIEVLNKLKKSGFRCEVDKRDEKIGLKIREAQLEKVPFMIIIGEKEVNTNSISVRSRDYGDLGVMDMKCFIGDILSAERNEKDIDIMK